jgi:predicted dipeptidase
MILLAVLLSTTLAAPVARVQKHYDRVEAKQLAPMLSEVLRFATYEGNTDAHAQQKAWLMKTAASLGLTARDAGKVVEIELPAPAKSAPVLGLVVHGDVQPVDFDAWDARHPPFAGTIENGIVYGRGAADDKGPLVQALLAMKALKESGVRRTHTVRLLVGSTEESDGSEMGEYLKSHAAPDYSLVLDSEFPVVVGEKAWNALSVTTPLGERGMNPKPYHVVSLNAGLAPSIVPDNAEIRLAWNEPGAVGAPIVPLNWDPIIDAIEKAKAKLPEGTRLVTGAGEGNVLRVIAYGKSAHAGVNLAGGRNALVALARVMEGMLPPGGGDDLLAFARLAGEDFYGTGLGITESDPVWGRYAVNVATIKPSPDDPKSATLTINIRRTPPRTGPQLRSDLEKFVAAFNARTGASLVPGGYYDDEPLGFDPEAKLVRRLLDDYAAATGVRAKPAISGGGTYAKRLPNAIAFGMWFPGKPYPGHDLDEQIPLADLQRGVRVLIYTLTDLATGPRIKEPFKR